MGCKCEGCFADSVSGSLSTIQVNILLEPGESYFWELTDGFGNVYHQQFIAEANGSGVIDLTQLPPGFANAGQASLKVRVKATLNDCDPALMPFIQKYECAEIKFNAGSTAKNFIGCSFDTTPAGPALLPPVNFAGTIAIGHSILTWQAPATVPLGTQYRIKQNGVVIFEGPEFTHDATGLINGQTYLFTAQTVAPDFSDSPAVAIYVTPNAEGDTFRLLMLAGGGKLIIPETLPNA
jgi:hypothetical protein